jgi:hypothetical protein
MSQQEIDERIIDLKRRVEVIEQMIGVHSLIPGDQAQFAKQAVLDALQTVKEMKEQALGKNKSIELYLKEHSRLCIIQAITSGSPSRTKAVW